MGAQVSIISRLGQDDFAKMALDAWEKSGVTPYIQQSPDDYTGAAYIFIEEASGNNAIIIAPGAAAKISAADLEAQAELIATADVFVTQLEQPMEAALKGLKIARSAGVKKILNPAPTANLPTEMLALCDYITPNETETEALTSLSVHSVADEAKATEVLCDMGVTTPIITLGDKGAYLQGHGLIAPFIAGAVAGTTGAGGAFNERLAAALSEGFTDSEVVKIGCAAAGISVTRAGTAPSMPTRKQVDRLIPDNAKHCLLGPPTALFVSSAQK